MSIAPNRNARSLTRHFVDAARRAGSHPASRPTAPSTSAAAVNVAGSRASTPWSSVATNRAAQKLIAEVFRVVPRKWRGVGEIPQSGLGLQASYAEFDAEARFGLSHHTEDEPAECISGLILQGIKKPYECPEFGVRCTPERPLGATMVSSEGACAAYYHYRRRKH
jgi:hydrogenase expression/formation protein HypD